jgi:hypothetical protein
MKESNSYGPQLTVPAVSEMLGHIFTRNLGLMKSGQPGTPVCIWGTHGLGKTQIVQDYAQSRGWQFAYCAPAQFEEMGDLHGMPTIREEEGQAASTVFAPPEWVPKKEGPGILLLDDINRADDRILRGLMQLLQNFAMFSWQLPPKWQIVATANPEGSGYSVTPMDEAMLTRMIHMTLSFDPKAWSKWATSVGIDSRGIDFVLNYPEAVTGERTTPRTLVQFFGQIETIPNLKAELDLVANLAASILDESTVAAFVSFINNDLGTLLSPQDILDTTQPQEMLKKLYQMAKGDGKAQRIDRISAICTRLFLYITDQKYQHHPRHVPNFSTFLQDQVIPNDLRLSIMQDLAAQESGVGNPFLKDRNLSALLLDKM